MKQLQAQDLVCVVTAVFSSPIARELADQQADAQPQRLVPWLTGPCTHFAKCQPRA